MAAQNDIIGREFDKHYIVVYSVCCTQHIRVCWSVWKWRKGMQFTFYINLLHVGLFASHLMGCVVFDW